MNYYKIIEGMLFIGTVAFAIGIGILMALLFAEFITNLNTIVSNIITVATDWPTGTAISLIFTGMLMVMLAGILGAEFAE